MTASTQVTSPFAVYAEYCRRGELAYQVDDGGKSVFHPRLVAPGRGGTSLTWRVSRGVGTVHATTVVFRKAEAPSNVVLVDLDEGFRMMSRVVGVPAEAVCIGMRVQVRFEPGADGQPPYPVFIPLTGPTESA